MGQILKKYRYFTFLFLTVFLFQSCKTDEFKFSEIKIKEDWGIYIISPLFAGKDKDSRAMEFRDFIHDWNKPVPDLPGPKVVLEYTNAPDRTIPSQLIFNPSAIIDSFRFFIQGSYNLSEIELEFTVANSCPFPLYLQLQFFDKSSWNKLGPPILPPAFLEANFAQKPVSPEITIHRIKLDSLQTISFMESDRVKFTSWFDSTNYINQNDTLSANYPINLTIVLFGKVQLKQ